MLERMLNVLPLASSIGPHERVERATRRVGERLAARGVAHRFVAPGGELADAYLIVTGGTEHLALEACADTGGPVLLLAHPTLNSLPAALEILGHLRDRGRPGRIFVVGDAGDGGGDLARAARYVEVHRRLRLARLGRVGAPSDWLVASHAAPEAVAAVWGPALVDVALEEVVEAMRRADPAAAAQVKEELTRGATAVDGPSPAGLDAAAALTVALREVAARHRLDALTLRCFDLIAGERTTGCMALSWLLDAGVVAGCEGDVPATLTMLWLQALTGEPSFMANPQDVEPASGTLALAHCTVARRLVSDYALRSHFESSLGVGIEGTIAAGPATLARIGGPGLREVFAADGEIVAADRHEERCLTQVRLRLAAGAGDLLSRPLGNHHVLSRGHWAAELREYHELLVGPR